jgi:SAM-dependent methyltransferase
MSQIFIQWKKPSGWFGRLLARMLNISHSKGTNWGLQHIVIEQNSTILDVGCGGGWMVHRLAGIAAQGKVYGIDFYEDCVTVSHKTNRQWVEKGRVEIQLASVSHLPFPDGMFNLVSAVNSHYYWPDLANDMHEVFRVAKPGGRFIIIGEAYKGGKFERRDQKWADWVNMTYLSFDELRELFSTTGYVDIQIFDQYDKGWICAIGAKPL